MAQTRRDFLKLAALGLGSLTCNNPTNFSEIEQKIDKLLFEKEYEIKHDIKKGNYGLSLNEYKNIIDPNSQLSLPDLSIEIINEILIYSPITPAENVIFKGDDGTIKRNDSKGFNQLPFEMNNTYPLQLLNFSNPNYKYILNLNYDGENKGIHSFKANLQVFGKK